MTTKLVLWGKKGTEEAKNNVLLALELHPDANKVQTWILEGEQATKEFAQKLNNEWKKGEAVAFPEGLSPQEQELTASANLLPEGIESEKEDILKRTQTEWLFMVLSTKLFRNYETTLMNLQERVEALESYDKKLWTEMKEFWANVQHQSRERNLLREHTNLLRERTNAMFSRMKELRAVEDAAFEKEAKKDFDALSERLQKVEDNLKEDKPNLHKLFETLKAIQRDFHNAKLTRSLRSKLWERLDGDFKAVKAKRFPGGSSAEGRLKRRIDGLEKAIDKMAKSIARDDRDLKSKTRRIESGNANQIEMQLAEVKVKMIRERIESKQRKLDDMYKTLSQLKGRLKTMQEKNAAEEAKKKAEAAKKKAAAKKAKAEENKVVEKVVETSELKIEVVKPLDSDDEDNVKSKATTGEEE